MTPDGRVLRTRWVGRVPYGEAEVLQRALHQHGTDDYLLMLEHPHVYTLGSRARLDNVLFDDPAEVGAELVVADRGGDVTYHGPGQLVGYPIVTLAEWRAGERDVVAYVRQIEQALIDALADLGVSARRSVGYPGVWVATERGEEKIAAIGVRVARGRTRHGFALNVDPDMAMFGHIVPCGIADRGVTSLRALLGDSAPSMQVVTERVAARFAEQLGFAAIDRADVAWRSRPEDLAPFSRSAADGGTPVRLIARLHAAGGGDGVEAVPGMGRPEWMKVRAHMDGGYLELKKLARDLDLHTVCEEAGCPNIYECWAQRTATFMVLGDRCTRACGFCLVDTRRPEGLDLDEPRRVAVAVTTMGLEHAVITCVARDDLADGGAAVLAATVHAIRTASPATSVELLISDCRGDALALTAIFDARPDVLNHNLETVARLQRAVRPSAGYARSLAVLARAKETGLTTKSGLMVGLGETDAEMRAAIADLRGVGVDILTIGQYLQPTAHHLPVARWWHPDELAELGEFACGLGFAHVECGPLVRSSYHARAATEAALAVPHDAAVLVAAATGR